MTAPLTLETLSDSNRDDVVSRVESAVSALQRGEVIVIAGEEPHGFGVMATAAEKVAQEQVAFMVRWGSGIISVPLSAERLTELELPMMVSHDPDHQRLAFTISVDARAGVTTGISADDRWRTIKALIDPGTSPDDLARPGHVYPMRYIPGGVLRRPRHAEAAVDLTMLAGLYPAAVLTEMMDEKGSHLRAHNIEQFATAERLVAISLTDLVSYRKHREVLVERVFERNLIRRAVAYRAFCYRSLVDSSEHLAFTLGDIHLESDPVPVALHSECLAGDVFRAGSCGCGSNLNQAFATIEEAGRGALLYMRWADVGDSMRREGKPLYCDREPSAGQIASSDYGMEAQILHDLGIRRVWLLTTRPTERSAIEEHGLTVVGSTPLD